ncbi:MAG: nitroreductase family protein [Promethearchaeota archaeon]
MDAMEAIVTRKSIRAFTDQEVTDDQIQALLQAMVASPSAGNRQPWRIYVVRDVSIKKKLAIGAYDQQFIIKAPVVFVVCRVPDESGARYKDRGRDFYSIQDTAAMTQNLLLAAHSMGLGGCWVGAFNDRAIGTAIECPSGVLPVSIIPVGYPAESPQARPRRPIASIVHFVI